MDMEFYPCGNTDRHDFVPAGNGVAICNKCEKQVAVQYTPSEPPAEPPYYVIMDVPHDKVGRRITH